MAEFRVGRMYHDSGNPVVPPAFLADKQTLRVPVMMRDAVCTTCDDTGRMKAGIWCPDCGGKNSGKDNQLTDAETQMRDHLARDQEYRRIHSGNMPGYRFAADTEATRASRQQLADAYAAYEETLTSAWKDVSTFEENTARLYKPPTPEQIDEIKRIEQRRSDDGPDSERPSSQDG